MSQTFQFDGYAVRPVDELDRPYLENLIRADVYHCDRMDADYFLKPLPGETAWALESPQGKVLFYFKTTPAVRMSIQFTGNETPRERADNREALTKGLAWLEATLAAARFRELLFDTEGPELTLFARKRMGFKEARGLMSRPIATFETLDAPTSRPTSRYPITTQSVAPEAVGTVPTDVQRREQ